MLPTSTRLTFSIEHNMPPDADGVVLFASDERHISGDGVMILSADELDTARRLLKSGVVEGRLKEIDFDLLERDGGAVQRIYIAGLGPAKEITPEVVRQAAGTLVRVARKHRLKHLAIVPPVINRGREAHGSEALITGLILGSFEYLENKGKASSEDVARSTPMSISILSSIKSKLEHKRCIERARIIAESQNFARTIAWRPGNTINPPALAMVAESMAKEVGLACRVLDEKQMRKLGMGGILAVGGGSPKTPPRMIVLEHKPPQHKSPQHKSPQHKAKGAPGNDRPLLVVGKAITFDTGGISIKPAEKMGKMIFDKCGGMAVLGLMAAVARLKLPVRVIGILASAENHVSDSAYRPGDVLTMYNGVTVEVTNTDAEGRLVLADALAWGIETYKPAACVDLATLTGGVIVALGRTMAGVIGNDDSLIAELTSIGERAGELMWRLPLGAAQRQQIKSEPADIVNSAGRDGHPLQGGAFLSHFVPDDASVPWAHLDIAGVADTDKTLPYYAKGATGWGVRTLVEWVTARAVEKIPAMPQGECLPPAAAEGKSAVTAPKFPTQNSPTRNSPVRKAPVRKSPARKSSAQKSPDEAQHRQQRDPRRPGKRPSRRTR